MTLAPSLLADTNVVSYLFKAPHHPKTVSYRAVLEGHTLFVSFMTIGELWRGAEEAGWGEKRLSDLRLYLERYIVASATANLGETWGTLMALSKRGGHNLGHADAWIAATALTRDVPLVSDNVRHFAWIPGLRLLTAQ